MPIESLEDRLKTLDYHQGIVLYWTCKGLKYEDIAERYKYTKAWCVWQMSFVYRTLGLDQKDPRTGHSLHWNQRREIIKDEVCPAFMQLIDNDLKNIERFPLIPKGVVGDPPSETPIPPPELPQLPSGQIPDPTSPPPEGFYPLELYNAWLMVLEDEKKDPIGEIVDPPIILEPRRDWRRILIITSVFACLGCLVVGVGAYFIGRGGFVNAIGTPVPTIQLTSTSTPSPTVQLTDTQTALPADTLTPTLTLTPTATLTPIPTNTKSPIGLVKGDELQDNRVTLKLTDIQYNQKYDRIGAKVAPISFFFDFTNHSGETIVLQFESSDFHSVDDTGYEADCWFYHISGAIEKVNEPLNNGDTREIVARCGLGNLNPNVTTVTLTIHPFSSLPESTWIAEVPH